MRNYKRKSDHKEKENKRKEETDSEDDDDALRLYCWEKFSHSKSKGKWIQCIKCHMWAHEQCAGGPKISSECENCDSIDDME